MYGPSDEGESLQLAETLAALDVVLSAADTAEIDRVIPATAIAETGYDEHGMRTLDSER
jgi:hypothetical protein